MGGFYATDLAFIHDDGFRAHVLEAAAYVLKRLQRRGIREGLVVDLGSGSGLLADALSRAGYGVLGIELSPAMIRLARQAAPHARFQRNSIFDACLPECAAVVSTGECLNYRPVGEVDLPAFFAHVAEVLVPGGLFLFDFADLDRGRGSLPFHRVEKDWALTVDYRRDPASRLLERRITAFRRVAKSYRRSDEVHRVQLFQPTEIATQLRRTGFRVRFFRGYGSPFPAGVRGIEAVKAGKTIP